MVQTYPPFGGSAPAEYNAALQQGRATLPRCASCGRSFFYPRPVCPHCHRDRLTVEDAEGPWTVVARTEVTRPQATVFEDAVPVLMVAAEHDGVVVIAEGHGWPAGAPPAMADAVRYRVVRRADGSPVPVFVPDGRD